MKTVSFTVKLGNNGRSGIRRRAIELYHQDSPFRGRKESSQIAYQRREKHAKKDNWSD
jgi:stalled ribosome alternative rescue factor ArfA